MTGNNASSGVGVKTTGFTAAGDGMKAGVNVSAAYEALLNLTAIGAAVNI